jgi:hypothetical protein
VLLVRREHDIGYLHPQATHACPVHGQAWCVASFGAAHGREDRMNKLMNKLAYHLVNTSESITEWFKNRDKRVSNAFWAGYAFACAILVGSYLMHEASSQPEDEWFSRGWGLFAIGLNVLVFIYMRHLIRKEERNTSHVNVDARQGFIIYPVRPDINEEV